MLKGNKVHAKLTLSWKKLFDSGIVTPKSANYCTECEKDPIWSECDEKINQMKEFAANLNETKENL